MGNGAGTRKYQSSKMEVAQKAETGKEKRSLADAAKKSAAVLPLSEEIVAALRSPDAETRFGVRLKFDGIETDHVKTVRLFAHSKKTPYDVINLRQVEVFDFDGKNWALASNGAKAWQASTLQGLLGPEALSEHSVDHLIDGDLSTYNHTDYGKDSTTEIYLAEPIAVNNMLIYPENAPVGEQPGKSYSRYSPYEYPSWWLEGSTMHLLNERGQVVFEHTFSSETMPELFGDGECKGKFPITPEVTNGPKVIVSGATMSWHLKQHIGQTTLGDSMTISLLVDDKNPTAPYAHIFDLVAVAEGTETFHNRIELCHAEVPGVLWLRVNGGRIVQTRKEIPSGWTHVLVTIEKNVATIYMNGVVTGQGIIEVPKLRRRKCYIGRSIQRDNAPFEGQVAEYHMWDRCLNADEINKLLLYKGAIHDPKLPAPVLSLEAALHKIIERQTLALHASDLPRALSSSDQSSFPRN